MSEEDKLVDIILGLPPCDLMQASKITDALGSDTFYSARTVAQMLLEERERCAKWRAACETIARDLRNHDMVRLGAAKCLDAGLRA